MNEPFSGQEPPAPPLRRACSSTPVCSCRHAISRADGDICHPRFHRADLPFANGKHGDFEWRRPAADAWRARH